MKKKKLFIHIGLGKTGTSALQRFLLDNRELLGTAGLLYPKTGLRGTAQHDLAESFGMGWLKEDKRLRLMSRRSRLWSELRDEVYCFGGNVVISSEIWPMNLQEFTTKEEPLESIKSCFPDYVVKILVYLRRQDQHAQSVYNQWMKTGHLKNNEKPFDFCKRYAYDYGAILKPLAQSVGKENVSVRVYDKAEFYGGNIFSDFLNAVCLVLKQRHLDNVIYPEKNANPKLSFKALQYLRVANSIGNYTHPSERTGFNQLIMQIFRARNPEELVDNHCLLNRIQIDEILREKRQSNKYVARAFLGRDYLFAEPDDDGQDAKDIETPLYHPDSIEIAVEIWEHLKEEMSRKDILIR